MICKTKQAGRKASKESREEIPSSGQKTSARSSKLSKESSWHKVGTNNTIQGNNGTEGTEGSNPNISAVYCEESMSTPSVVSLVHCSNFIPRLSPTD